MDVKTKEFILFYAPDCRKRHQHHRHKKAIVKFIVQLEVLIKEKWYPVIRYDTTHGFAHCDILHYNGKIEKIMMPDMSYKGALNYAGEDINENWEIYRALFLKEVKNEK